MLTKPIELNLHEGLIELVLEGGDFHDGDYRPRITIRLPADINPNGSVDDVRRMMMKWAIQELQSHTG